MTITNTPHDDFFYQVMSRKEQAHIFLGLFLPLYIRAEANLSQITLYQSKHLSDEGIDLYNDVLYRCPLAQGQMGYFFVMCEHQSTPEAQMPLRLLKYNIATIEDHLHQGHEHFPVVVNIVFYHGKRPWNYSTAFVDYYKNPKLGAQSLYMAPFTLVRLPARGDDELYRNKELGFCFAAFRCTRSTNPYKAFSSMLREPLFREYFQNLPTDLRYLMISYLGQCISRSGHSLKKLVTLAANNQGQGGNDEINRTRIYRARHREGYRARYGAREKSHR